MSADDLTEAVLAYHASGTLTRAYGQLRERMPAKRTYWDRACGAEAMARHVEAMTPEIIDGGIRVMDIGAGVGMFLEFCRAADCDAIGIDAEVTEGSHVEAYQRVTDALGLDVSYVGILSWVDEGLHLAPYDLIHARGSLDLALCGRGDQTTRENTEAFLAWIVRALAPDGRFVAMHNDGPVSWEIIDIMRETFGDACECPGPLTTIITRREG